MATGRLKLYFHAGKIAHLLLHIKMLIKQIVSNDLVATGPLMYKITFHSLLPQKLCYTAVILMAI